MSRRKSRSLPLTQKQFRVIAATTLGYYLVRDLVKKTWLRRAGQTAVLATGVSVALTDEWHALSDKEQKGILDGLSQAKEKIRVQDTSVPAVGAMVALPVATVGAAAWLNGKADAAGTAVVTGTLGRLPLVGGLFRALPSTTYGAAQVGVLYLVNERARG